MAEIRVKIGISVKYVQDRTEIFCNVTNGYDLFAL